MVRATQTPSNGNKTTSSQPRYADKPSIANSHPSNGEKLQTAVTIVAAKPT